MNGRFLQYNPTVRLPCLTYCFVDLTEGYIKYYGVTV